MDARGCDQISMTRRSRNTLTTWDFRRSHLRKIQLAIPTAVRQRLVRPRGLLAPEAQEDSGDGSAGAAVPDARRTRLASMKLRWISAIARRWAAVSSGADAIASARSDWGGSSAEVAGSTKPARRYKSSADRSSATASASTTASEGALNPRSICERYGLEIPTDLANWRMGSAASSRCSRMIAPSRLCGLS